MIFSRKNPVAICGPASRLVLTVVAKRHIYIRWVYDIDEKNNWSSRGDTSILIAASKIRTMEFWPYEPEETKNESKEETRNT